MEWLKNHLYELNIFVSGWCTFATFDCLMKEQYSLAALNAFLAVVNLKLSQRNK